LEGVGKEVRRKWGQKPPFPGGLGDGDSRKEEPPVNGQDRGEKQGGQYEGVFPAAHGKKQTRAKRSPGSQ
jgi:hypothetical protein